MKLSLALPALWLSFASSATARDAYMYTFDTRPPPTTSNKPSSISLETANLIIAKRLGFSEQVTLFDVDEKAIVQLNEFGGRQSPLFGDVSEGEDASKLLVAWIGFDDKVSTGIQPNITIPKPQDHLASENYIIGALAHRRLQNKHFRMCEYSVPGGLPGVLLIELPGTATCPSADSILPESKHEDLEIMGIVNFLKQDLTSRFGHGTTAMLVFSTEDSKSSKYLLSPSNLIHPTLRSHATNNLQETTLLYLPAFQDPNLAWPSSNSQQNSKSRRQLLPEEEPLSSSSFRPSENSPPHLAQSNSSTGNKPLLHLPPTCYTSLTACETSTNNCSSHGICRLAYAPKDSAECYRCTCHSTPINGNLDHTTTWGGAACQKKDVSVPFFLFASIGVALTMTVAWGIGLLFSIGEEGLPSVIGAGVAGPRAQR